VDGDTVVLEGEIKIRYIGVDTPESTTSVECYGPEAAEFNKSLVEGKVVTLEYDEECTDKYGRTLAYVSVDGVLASRALIDKGYGCALIMAPNDAKKEELEEAEMVAQVHGEGLWSACDPNPCK
jgi:micrococcal nuclease